MNYFARNSLKILIKIVLKRFVTNNIFYAPNFKVTFSQLLKIMTDQNIFYYIH